MYVLRFDHTYVRTCTLLPCTTTITVGLVMAVHVYCGNFLALVAGGCFANTHTTYIGSTVYIVQDICLHTRC